MEPRNNPRSRSGAPGSAVAGSPAFSPFDLSIGDRDRHKSSIKPGQTHVQRYMKPLLERIQRDELDPSFVITHRMRLEDAARGYELFLNKDECMKVVLQA